MKGTQIERNISRLSLIAAINRVPLSATAWVRELQIDTLGIQRIECKSGRDQVIPHGTDNDLLVGLINAYVQQGMREDRVVKLSVSELLNLSGLEPCGSNYRAAEEGLERLKTALFTMYDSWWDNTHHQFTKIKFNIVERYQTADRYAKDAVIGQFQASNLLELQLAPEITNSIRSGYLRVLDPEIYHRLKQSLARTLYRTLEEVRTPVGQVPVKQYLVAIHDWATHLGLQDSSATRIRRTLQPAHDNLITSNYLRSVEYQGRGRTQSLIYTFSELAPATSATSVALLTTRGVGHDRAVRCAQGRSEAQLRQAISIFEGILARGGKKITNAPGLLVSIIENPDNYPVGESATPARVQVTKAHRGTVPDADPLPGISAQERKTTFLRVANMFNLPPELLQQAAQNIADESVDVPKVTDVQSRLVKLHMEGATQEQRVAALSELL